MFALSWVLFGGVSQGNLTVHLTCLCSSWRIGVGTPHSIKVVTKYESNGVLLCPAWHNWPKDCHALPAVGLIPRPCTGKEGMAGPCVWCLFLVPHSPLDAALQPSWWGAPQFLLPIAHMGLLRAGQDRTACISPLISAKFISMETGGDPDFE